MASAQSPAPSFLARTDYFAGGPNSVVVADLNNDGIPDIVTDSLDVFLGNGDGTFRPLLNIDPDLRLDPSHSATKSASTIGATWVVKGHFHGTRTEIPDLAVPSIDGIDVLLNTTK